MPNITGIAVSVLSLLVAGGSLYVSILAFRRSGSDRRLHLRQGARELEVLLDGAVGALANARRSRPNVLAMEGLAHSGNAQIFEREAAADLAELSALQAKAGNDFGEVASDISDIELENKLVDLYGIKARVGQIRAKYVAAFAEDDQKRSEKRQAMHALGNQILKDRGKGTV